MSSGMDPHRIWFTADTHFGHRGIVNACNRPCGSVSEMDAMLIDNWNARVRPEHDVFHLGDFSFSRPDRTIEIIRALNGHIHLILGNHDHNNMNVSIHRYFEHVHDIRGIKVEDEDAGKRMGGRQFIELCHYPMVTWNRSHYGAWMLHGHSHGNLKEDPHAYRLDVGVDAWGYAPVSYWGIKQRMAMKLGFAAVDHHGS